MKREEIKMKREEIKMKREDLQKLIKEEVSSVLREARHPSWQQMYDEAVGVLQSQLDDWNPVSEYEIEVNDFFGLFSLIQRQYSRPDKDIVALNRTIKKFLEDVKEELVRNNPDTQLKFDTLKKRGGLVLRVKANYSE